MLRRKNRVMVIAVSLVAVGGLWGTAAAQKDSAPKAQNKLALAEEPVKQCLLLMETDQHGKVSKQEYMKFMEAEFARLDKDRNGELDVKAIMHPTTVTASRYTGK